MRSRQRFDPLATSSLPRWLVTTDIYRNRLSVTALVPGADLRAMLRVATERDVADGWLAESDASYGFLFIARDSERLLLSVTGVDPDVAPGAGHAHLTGCTSVRST